MEKAIERQRVLLQHLLPTNAASSLDGIESSISVSRSHADDLDFRSLN